MGLTARPIALAHALDLDTGKLTISAAIVQLGWQAVESTVKSDDSDATIALDKDTVAVLKAWREAQLAERLRWGEACQTRGLDVGEDADMPWMMRCTP